MLGEEIGWVSEVLDGWNAFFFRLRERKELAKKASPRRESQFRGKAGKAIILMENCFHVYRNAEEAISPPLRPESEKKSEAQGSVEASILHFFFFAISPPENCFSL